MKSEIKTKGVDSTGQEHPGKQLLKNMVAVAVYARFMQYLSWEMQPVLNDLRHSGVKVDRYEDINNDIYKLTRKLKELLAKSYDSLPPELVMDKNWYPILDVFSGTGNTMDVIYENVRGTAFDRTRDILSEEVLRYFIDKQEE